jgi:phosphoribosyl 1,2-cyclic phosphodiesterase
MNTGWSSLEVRFWGVRGSIPTPGETTRRWGGNTSCLEIRHPGLPPLVFDCGTGARDLGGALLREPWRELDLLFTHFHMDHVFGFPFFAPLYTPGYQVRVTVPAYSEEEARERVARYLNGVYHPTRLRDVPSNVTFYPVRPGQPFQRGGFQVTACALNHPGGSLGYRVEAGGQSIVYFTDSAPFARPGEGVAAGEPPLAREAKVIEFLAGADVVVYDTMYELDEYLERMTWGHSYPEYAEALCRAAGVRHLVLFHHAPDCHDATLDERAERWSRVPGPMRISCAKEGEVVAADGHPVADVVPVAVGHLEGGP